MHYIKWWHCLSCCHSRWRQELQSPSTGMTSHSQKVHGRAQSSSTAAVVASVGEQDILVSGHSLTILVVDCE